MVDCLIHSYTFYNLIYNLILYDLYAHYYVALIRDSADQLIIKLERNPLRLKLALSLVIPVQQDRESRNDEKE